MTQTAQRTDAKSGIFEPEGGLIAGIRRVETGVLVYAGDPAEVALGVQRRTNGRAPKRAKDPRRVWGLQRRRPYRRIEGPCPECCFPLQRPGPAEWRPHRCGRDHRRVDRHVRTHRWHANARHHQGVRRRNHGVVVLRETATRPDGAMLDIDEVHVLAIDEEGRITDLWDLPSDPETHDRFFDGE